MTTYAAPAYAVGQCTYGTGKEVKEKWLEAIYNFAVYGADTDFKSTVTPISNVSDFDHAQWSPWLTAKQWGSIYPEITYTGMRFHNGDTSNPPALQNFTAPNLLAINDTFQVRTMHEWDAEIDPAFSQIAGFRQRFHVVNTWPSLEAMNIVHDTYYGLMNTTLFGRLGDVWIGGLTPMPISTQFFRASKVNGGDPMGIDPLDGPQIWYEINLSFANKQEYDDIATEFLDTFEAELEDNLSAAGIKRGKYLYLNDADKGQPVFEGYPMSNVQRLQAIRHKYDPQRVFTDLMPGGWKVANVE